MLLCLVITLPVSLLVALAVLGYAFLDVAFQDPRTALATTVPQPEWQPPVVHDQELFAWAIAAARTAVRNHWPPRGGNAAAQALVAELARGIHRAISSSPYNRLPLAEHACSSCRHQLIAVTVPEVLAIAGALEARRPAELARIRERASQNSARSAGLNPLEYQAAGLECPLLCADNSCAANGSRPIQCRGWLRLAEPLSESAETRGTTADIDPHAFTVSQGVAEGLASELVSLRLDGGRYELSSALTVALTTPHAAESWAAGRPVFAGSSRPAQLNGETAAR